MQVWIASNLLESYLEISINIKNSLNFWGSIVAFGKYLTEIRASLFKKDFYFSKNTENKINVHQPGNN